MLQRAFQFAETWGVVLAAVVAAAVPATADGESLLADAAEHREVETVRELLKTSADVDAPQADGTTALHWAARYDEAEVARLLIEAGADPRVTNRFGIGPLALACQNGNGDLVELLLEAGADPNAAIPGDETPLMTAARTGKLGPVEALLDHGARVDDRESSGQTALMWAAAEGHVDVVQRLIQAGADISRRLPSGFTPLMFAVRGGHIPATKRLLAAGCGIEQVLSTQEGFRFGRDPWKLTPLLLAVENGHFELAKELLAAGADPNARPSGYTALHAVTWVRKPIRGDGNPPPRGSGKLSSLDLVRLLVEGGADVNAPLRRGRSELGRFTYTGSTPFLLAAQASDLPLMKLLVELGADPHLTNADGTDALAAAAGVGALGDGDESAGTDAEALVAVSYLLELGLDPNSVDDNGETALHGAAYQSRANLVPVLVAHGAKPDVWNHENRAGWTPLTIALGYRPGNFRPAPETIDAIEQAMRAANATRPDADALAEHERIWTGASNQSTPWVIRDLQYAHVGNTPLLLDLHMPQHVRDSPLVVWVHGGAWRSGSKRDMPLSQLVRAGYSVASVDYRLSPVAPFPAQVHDIKAAIRFLRSLSSRYGYRVDRIAIAGASAGGHLAALVGTTNRHADLEGTVGDCLDQSSEVQAIVDFYGPTNLATILAQSTPHGLGVRIPALQLLLGGQPDEKPQLARLASPVEHVDASDPPLLLLYGDQDPQVPINQAHELHGKYLQFELTTRLEVLHGAGHGGEVFYDEQTIQTVRDFLSDARTD